MNLKSSAFENDTTIPKKYGYKHGNLNPPLTIDNIPPNTKSLVLIMDDPDALEAVGKVWVHWILYNLQPNITSIPENSLPKNSFQGRNDFDEIGYGGPAPPDKEHKYIFTLYALDKILNIQDGTTKTEIENLIQNNIIEKCFLFGKYAPS